jgi:AmiR/NasT family two-component response regulator
VEVHEGVITDGLPQLPRPLHGLRQPRGQNTLLMMAVDGNARTLRDNLEKLGFFVSGCDVSREDPQTGSVIAGAGVIIVETDHLEPATVSVLAASPAPIIALIAHESPSRLQRALEMEPFSILMKLAGHRGVFASLFFAFNEHQRRRHLRDELSTARGRLGARRIVVKAIIYLIGIHGFDDDEAYRHLRNESMRKRISVEELSASIIAGGQDRQRNASPRRFTGKETKKGNSNDGQDSRFACGRGAGISQSDSRQPPYRREGYGRGGTDRGRRAADLSKGL